MPKFVLDVPRSLRRGGKLNDVETSVDYMLKIFALMYRKLDIPDLGNLRILDMGCGWRMSKTILEHEIPIEEYVGVDVFAPMIEFLQSEINDPRFKFQLLDTHNQMYNPEGKPITEMFELDLPENSFDIVTLFSVFTHLNPQDFAAMLKLLRPYAKPDGKLIFSLLVNEATPEGLGFIDGIMKHWSSNPDIFKKHEEAFSKQFAGTEVPKFVDFDPAFPLRWALYSRQYALELVENAGWEVESLNYPEEAIPHYMICKPGIA